MFWKLILNQQIGRVELCNDERCIASREWTEARNTSQEILKALKEIREEEKLDWGQIPELKLELDLPPHATARRIAETMAKVYALGFKHEADGKE